MHKVKAWILNLDADVELSKPVGSRYERKHAMREVMRPHVETLATTLLGPGDILIDEDSAPGAARHYVGEAFCPTDYAVDVLKRAGAELASYPAQSILRHVNGRAFCASLGQTLSEAEFITTVDNALAKLAEAPLIARQWRAKRMFGMAGRGQRVIAPNATLSDADVAFLRAGIADGGVQIEPQVTIEQELGIHGRISDQQIQFGKIVEQTSDAHGQWIRTVVATGVDEAIEASLRTSATEVADALAAAGYFGPFGVDAFTFVDVYGKPGFQARSEINARYSMGFSTGFY